MAFIATVLLGFTGIAGLSPVAQAQSGLRFTISTNQGRAGNSTQLTPVDACPASTEYQYVALTLVDSANTEFWLAGVGTRPDGSWDDVPLIIPAKSVQSLSPVTFREDPAVGSAQIRAKCQVMSPQGWVTTAEYAPVAYTVTESSRKFTVSAQVAELGQQVTVSMVDSCSNVANEGLATIGDFSGRYISAQLPLNGTGAWGAVSLTIPPDWRLGHYIVRVMCYVNQPSAPVQYEEYAAQTIKVNGFANLVGLGDSFASGQGAGSYEPGTDGNGNKCYRSNNAYSKTLPTSPAPHLKLTAFVACGGATTADVINGKAGESSQLDAIDYMETDVVTISIGGNDIGFKDFAIACVTPGTSCDGAPEQQAVGKAQNELPAKLEELFNQVKWRIGPQTKVLIVGYPWLIEDVNYTAPYCGYLFPEEKAATQHVINQLNSTLVAAVQEAGTQFSYVDANGNESPFKGHGLCYSDSYFQGLTWPDVDATFHPNSQGHEAFRKLIANYLATLN